MGKTGNLLFLLFVMLSLTGLVKQNLSDLKGEQDSLVL